MTVEWVWQWCLSKCCDGLGGLYSSLWPRIMEEQHSDTFLVVQTPAFTLLKVLFYRKIHFCSPKQEVDMNNTFLISKGCSHDFSCWWHTVELLLPCKCHVASFGLLPIGFRFKVVHPGGILQGLCLLVVTNTERCEARTAITTDLLYWKDMGVRFLALYCILYKHSINT
jgi:hypothetical protein